MEEETDVAWTAPAPPAITQAALAPVAASGPPPINPPDAHVSPAPAATYARTGSFRIQAGSFGEEVNARKAADTLARAGAQAEIEPVDHDGVIYYRVVVRASGDETEAWAMRDMVAGYGFSDARVTGPF